MWVILLLSNTSLSAQGPCCPYTPAIIGPDRPAVIGFAPFLLVSLPKDSLESQNPLFSPFAFSNSHGCCASLDMSLPPLLHWRNTHSNHSVSTLLAHPPTFTGLSLNNLSLTDSLSSQSVLGESNSLLISPQHPSLPSPPSFHHSQHLRLCVCVCVHACLCICVKL